MIQNLTVKERPIKVREKKTTGIKGNGTANERKLGLGLAENDLSRRRL